MLVQVATTDDISNWLNLAEEVEFLFGPMVNNPNFHAALRKNIDRASAYCVREQDRLPGTRLMGGLFFSAKPPVYQIGWLSIAKRWRRKGVGTLLVEHVVGLVEPPAYILVRTFGEDNSEGLPARRFYEKMGFIPFEDSPPGPEGVPEKSFAWSSSKRT